MKSDSKLSLHYSCSDRPFLSVSAYLAHHSGFPDLDLRLIDPLGRSSGTSNTGKGIPKSQHGRIIEIRRLPMSSKAVAVEVCEPVDGDYVVVVSEHTDGRYGFSVRADNGHTGSESMGSVFRSWRGRTCNYSFRLRMTDRPVTLRWLNGNDNAQTSEPEPICDIPKR